jgi:type IV secretory pathway TrbD component
VSPSRIIDMLWGALAVLFTIVFDLWPAVLFPVAVYLFASYGDIATALAVVAVMLYWRTSK